MAWRYEQGPGSDVTLLALYNAVEAAEEFDLAEQARIDADWLEACALYGFGQEDDAPDDEESVVDESARDVERPRMSQAVGLIEHLLGGQHLPGV